ATADRLLRDKLTAVDWRAAGLTGMLAQTLRMSSALASPSASDPAELGALPRLAAALLRWGARRAMRVVGGQFVFAETIEAALARAHSRPMRSYRYSFDMLGEAALTAADAQRYFGAYERAIHAVGSAYGSLGPIAGGSVSVKLSALHPRFHYAQ